MDNEMIKVLVPCIERARKGEYVIDVFELMYETGFAYSELKSIADKLVSQNELKAIDLKTYVFTGDINREFIIAEAKKDDPPPQKTSAADVSPFLFKRNEIDRRRQEYLARMRAETNEDADEDDDFDTDIADDFAVFDPFSAICAKEKREENSLAKRLLHKILKRSAQNAASPFTEAEENEPFEFDGGETPQHFLWENEEAFESAVMERIERLVRSDLKMSRSGAVEKAKEYLFVVRDTRDGAMAQVYERIVYELKNMGDGFYGKIRKCIRKE